MSIDTGGTFTDGFVSDGEHTAQVKVDTTPQDLTIGFQACLEAAAAAVGHELPGFLGALSRLHFSSTIATNTIVERRGAPRRADRDARGAKQLVYGTDDAGARRWHGLLDLDLVRGVREEMDAAGAVVAPPSESELEIAVRELLERGVRLLVVSFANAHLNQANELRARELIDRSYPRHYLGAVPLLVASRVSLAGDDHGRTAAAVVNAYLHPNLVRALYLAEDRARERGLTRPLLIVNTDGSTSRVAKTRAIDTYDSGPTAGVLGASYVARALGAENVCTFDVGGTTTDVSFLAGGRGAGRARSPRSARWSIPHPSVVAALVRDRGRLDHRASTRRGDPGRPAERRAPRPGPACFGLGGEWLTPTDVWLLLGYLEPGEFLGGRRRLSVEPAAPSRWSSHGRLRYEPRAARCSTAKEAIRRELAEHLLRLGRSVIPSWRRVEPATRWLFSYGGGGGLLCAEAADILGIPRVVVLPHSSVFSAFGAGLLPIAHSYETVVPARIGRRGAAAAVARLADNARRDLRAEGVRDLDGVRASLAVGSERRDGADAGRACSSAPRRWSRATAPPRRRRVALHVSVPRDAVCRDDRRARDRGPGRPRAVLTARGLAHGSRARRPRRSARDPARAGRRSCARPTPRSSCPPAGR